MEKVVLVGCGKKKCNYKSEAKSLYQGSFFKLNLQYAQTISDEIYILSAKYGLLELDKKIKPYNLIITKLTPQQQKIWSYKVIKSLEEKNIYKDTHIVFLAGENYIKYLKRYYKNYEQPMKGLRMGKRMAFLKDELERKKNEKIKRIN